jgi:hypothetical protein
VHKSENKQKMGWAIFWATFGGRWEIFSQKLLVTLQTTH